MTDNSGILEALLCFVSASTQWCFLLSHCHESVIACAFNVCMRVYWRFALDLCNHAIHSDVARAHCMRLVMYGRATTVCMQYYVSLLVYIFKPCIYPAVNRATENFGAKLQSGNRNSYVLMASSKCLAKTFFVH